MKNLYYSYLTTEGKKLFKLYCVDNDVGSFKMQNYSSCNYPIPQDFKDWIMNEFVIDNFFQ